MKIDVLDHGYVQYIHHMGDDKEVINAARASYNKSIEVMEERDSRLLAYLFRQAHGSVLRHCAVTLAVRAPLFVARQLWKYHVATAVTEGQDGWNESSRRYVTEEPQFYIPQWRRASVDKKQGSGAPLDDLAYAHALRHRMIESIEDGVIKYDLAIAGGIAPEQARCFLPAYAMYVSWHWTLSMQSVLHMLSERLQHDAQWETTEYAKAIHEIVKGIWPETLAAWEANERTH